MSNSSHDNGTRKQRRRFLAYVFCGVTALIASHWFAAQTLSLVSPFVPGPKGIRDWAMCGGALLIFSAAFWAYRHRHHVVRQLDWLQAVLGLLVLLGGQWTALAGEHGLEHLFEHQFHLPHHEFWLAAASLILYLLSALGVLKLRPQFQGLPDRMPSQKKVIAR